MNKNTTAFLTSFPIDLLILEFFLVNKPNGEVVELGILARPYRDRMVHAVLFRPHRYAARS